MAEVWVVAWLCASAVGAGLVNAVAGGGTLLTFPALVAALSSLGADEAAVVANVTSTVALAPGSLASAWGYRSELHRMRQWLWLLSGPSLVGGVLGGLLVTRLDPAYFGALVPWLTLLAATLFLVQPVLAKCGTLPRSLDAGRAARSGALGIAAFQFLVGIYGGYFGAGIGILMLGALAVTGLADVHQMNALKTVLAFLINAASIVVFVAPSVIGFVAPSTAESGLRGRVHWPYALIMAAAAIVGGYLGARGARHLPRRLVRWVVIAVGLGLSAWFFHQRHIAGLRTAESRPGSVNNESNQDFSFRPEATGTRPAE